MKKGRNTKEGKTGRKTRKKGRMTGRTRKNERRTVDRAQCLLRRCVDGDVELRYRAQTLDALGKLSVGDEIGGDVARVQLL